jgi:hypothetical protein
MKLNKPQSSPPQIEKTLYDVLREYVKVSSQLMSVLRENPVASRDEVTESAKKLLKVKTVVVGVLQRTMSSRRLDEQSDIMHMDDIQLQTKLERQEPEISYLVSLSTGILDKLLQLQHIQRSEHEILTRYWLSLPVQHKLLCGRWETARNT